MIGAQAEGLSPAPNAEGSSSAPCAEGLSSVRNAARVLKAFRTRERELSVAELARRLELGKSTVHRVLRTLVAEGLVEQDPQTSGYRLGIVTFELGEAVRVHLDLHAAAGPVLTALREQTRETSQVGVLDGADVVYVDRTESPQALRLFTEMGRRVPVHCTSSGKVLLAWLDDEPLTQLLTAHAPLARLTPHTITDPAALRLEVARVRHRGWAEAVQEREVGVASIAAPVRDSSGTVVAAVSIGAPLVRLSPSVRRRLVPIIVDAGEAISRRLGWSEAVGALSGAGQRNGQRKAG
jgi:DNA-binding IclR family transcriptional regulator